MPSTLTASAPSSSDVDPEERFKRKFLDAGHGTTAMPWQSGIGRMAKGEQCIAVPSVGIEDSTVHAPGKPER